MLLLALEPHVLFNRKGIEQSLHYCLLLFVHLAFLEPQFDVPEVLLGQSDIAIASFYATLGCLLLSLNLLGDNLYFLQELLDARGRLSRRYRLLGNPPLMSLLLALEHTPSKLFFFALQAAYF